MTTSTTRNRRSTIGIWWQAVRPYAYPASIMPAVVGIAYAWSCGVEVAWGWAVLTLVGVVAAHTGGNLFNDFEDYRRGVDRPGTLGGNGLLVDRTLAPRAIFIAALISFAVAGTVAVPLVMHVGLPLLWLILVGFVAGTGYVLPPLGLKYRAMGDVVVFLAFGIGVTVGSYSVQAGELSFDAAPVAIPLGLLVAAILHVNNIRDRADDRAVGVRTVAGLVGGRLARLLFVALFVGAYGVTLVLIVADIVPAGAALVIITAPLAISIARQVWLGGDGDRRLIEAVPRTAQLSLVFGLALTTGIVLWEVIA